MYFEEGLAVNGWASVCDGRLRYLCFFYTLFCVCDFFYVADVRATRTHDTRTKIYLFARSRV